MSKVHAYMLVANTCGRQMPKVRAHTLVTYTPVVGKCLGVDPICPLLGFQPPLGALCPLVEPIYLLKRQKY